MERNRKAMEWERLDISSRKLEKLREHSFKDGHETQKWVGPNESRRDKEEVTRIHRRIV